MKWRHSTIKCPVKARGYYAILTNNDIIHLFQRDSNKHFTIKVGHIISQKELNAAENQQETAYKVIKQSMQKKPTLEIERQKEIGIDKTLLSSSKRSNFPSTPPSSSFSTTSIPKQYEMERILQKDIYAPFKPNSAIKMSPKEIESIDHSEHVPMFSDDDEVQYDKDEKDDDEKPKSTGYHISNISNDSFYNDQNRTRIVKKSPKSSTRSKPRVKPNNNDNHHNINNHIITRQEIDSDRFSCKIVYDLFTTLCGLQQPPNNRVDSYSYQSYNTDAPDVNPNVFSDQE